MEKWRRSKYQPVLPLGEDGKRLTGSTEHIELSKRAAAEGMVLLKNQNKVLPLEKGAHIVLLGKGTIDYVKGGGGSGDVFTEYIHNLADGMAVKAAEGKVAVFTELVDFYKDYVAQQYAAGFMKGMLKEPSIPKELLAKAKNFGDTAVVSISRFSGEGWDRGIDSSDDIRTEYAMWPGEEVQRQVYRSVFKTNDFYLTEEELQLLEVAKTNFKKVVVVLNVGGVIDTNWTLDDAIDGVLIAWQGGMEGGLAEAEVLCGDVNPSGHLTDTFAKKLSDYPSTEGFHDSADFVEYKEDIFVGYRYFSTIPGAAEKVNYPFGFGLSYTDFACEIVEAIQEETNIIFTVKVTNTGKIAGKEVVQLYYEAPQGVLAKSARVLGAFAKTKTLAPQESETVTLCLCINDMKSFDDSGKIKDASWVMEKGSYHFYIGKNVRDALKTDFVFELPENLVLETTGHKVEPTRLTERLLADGSREKLECKEPKPDVCGLKRQEAVTLEGWHPQVKAVERICAITEEKPLQLMDVVEGRVDMDEFIHSLSLEDRLELLGGQSCTGVAITCGVGNNPLRGIPNIMTADGPAGLRTSEVSGVTTTAWPVAISLAASWNTELMEEIGKEAALEVKENNLGFWLAPACNIHRSPLCGRNFEYFSEDPYVSGKAAIAIIRGTQSQGIGATPKHFAANNKETNRKASDSVVSERALREIYLKQFEMIVKEADPFMLMSSYNKINGIPASENAELLTGILREEWGYEGVVTSDWWTLGEHYLETKAGNDLKMACGYPERVQEAYDKGLISDEEINASVKRILRMILRVD